MGFFGNWGKETFWRKKQNNNNSNNIDIINYFTSEGAERIMGQSMLLLALYYLFFSLLYHYSGTQPRSGHFHVS